MRRGFSLAEALLTIFFVFTVFGFLAMMMQDYSRMSRHMNSRDRALTGLQNALMSLRADIEGASSVNVGTNTLTVRRVDPGKRGRLTPTSSDWQVANVAFTMEVSYSINSDQDLVRRYRPAGGVMQEFVVAQGVQGLTVRDVSGSNAVALIEVALSFLEDKQVRTVKTRVARRVGFE